MEKKSRLELSRATLLEDLVKQYEMNPTRELASQIMHYPGSMHKIPASVAYRLMNIRGCDGFFLPFLDDKTRVLEPYLRGNTTDAMNFFQYLFAQDGSLLSECVGTWVASTPILVEAAVKTCPWATTYLKDSILPNAIVENLIKQDGRVYSFMLNDMSDRKLIVAALTAVNNPVSIVAIPGGESMPRDILELAVKRKGENLRFLKSYVAHVDWIKMALQQDGMFLRFAKGISHETECVQIAVKQNGMALQFASDELRGNKEIVTMALMQDGNALMYASRELQGEVEIVKIAVSQNGMALQYVNPEFRGDYEVVRSAVRNHGGALKLASRELQGNLEIVKTAVIRDGMVLEFASMELKGNLEIVKDAVKQNGMALHFASDALKENMEVVKAALHSTIAAYSEVSYKLFKNEKLHEICISRMRNSPETLFDFQRSERHGEGEIFMKTAHFTLGYDLDRMKRILAYDGTLIRHASHKIRSNHELIKIAVRSHAAAIKFIGDECHEDTDLMLALVKESPATYMYMRYHHRENPAIASIAVQKCYFMRVFAPAEIVAKVAWRE